MPARPATALFLFVGKGETMTATETDVSTGKMIYKALAAIQREITAIARDNRNAQQGFNFRSIYDCYNVIHPLLAKHGVFVAQEVIGEPERFERETSNGGTLFYITAVICHRFYAEDGSFVPVTTIGEGMDSGDKAANKAMSMAMKYALVGLFTIPDKAGDPDGDNDSYKVKPIRQAQQQPSSAKPAGSQPSRTPPRTDAKSGEVMTIDNVKIGKEGKRKNGDPWRMWLVIADGLEFSTFSSSDAEIAEQNIGKPCRLEWEIGQFGNKLTHVEPAGADDQDDNQADSPGDPAVGSTGETPQCNIMSVSKKDIEGKTGSFTAWFVTVDAPDFRGEKFATTKPKIAKELEQGYTAGRQVVLYWHQTAKGKMIDDANFFEPERPTDTTSSEYAANPPEDDIPF